MTCVRHVASGEGSGGVWVGHAFSCTRAWRFPQRADVSFSDVIYCWHGPSTRRSGTIADTAELSNLKNSPVHRRLRHAVRSEPADSTEASYTNDPCHPVRARWCDGCKNHLNDMDSDRSHERSVFNTTSSCVLAAYLKNYGTPRCKQNTKLRGRVTRPNSTSIVDTVCIGNAGARGAHSLQAW